MPIFRKLNILLVGAVLLVSASNQSLAFDPEKVFEDKKPSLGTLFRYFFKAREQGNEAEAIDALKYAAEKGSQAAQWKLGRMYQVGDGVAKDPRAAYEFFSAIAENYANAQPGTPEWQFTSSAMVALGHYHRVGVPEARIPLDLDKARVMYTTAATYFGNPEAQFELARMFLEGENNNAEIIQAARLLKSAATAGHVGAEALLGHLFFEGKHLTRDPVRGLSMMVHAQKSAVGADSAWISKLVEEALAVASDAERREAIAVAGQEVEKVSQ